VNTTNFWYAGYVYNDNIYSASGEKIDDLSYMTATAQSLNVTGLDTKNKQYCIKAKASNNEVHYNYTVVDCDDNNPAFYLCYREPVNCSADDGLPAARRKRALVGDATLDAVFVHSKKMENNVLAERARSTYSENFKKMNLQKSFGSLFEILW
jgi:hypothetical protein